MIILFTDFSTDYWIKNKIVDCGLSDTNQQLHINLELPDYELPDYELPDYELLENELIFLDKLNVKTKNIKFLKQYNIKRNPENNDRFSIKKDSRYKFGNSDFRIHDIQESSKHTCSTHTGFYSNNYKRKVKY